MEIPDPRLNSRAGSLRYVRNDGMGKCYIRNDGMGKCYVRNDGTLRVSRINGKLLQVKEVSYLEIYLLNSSTLLL